MKFLDIGRQTDIYGDGIHDDTKAIQRCLDALREGGTVWFPDGIYRISACLIFYSHQHLWFSDNAVLLRDVTDGAEPTRYLLASHSDPETGGYDGTHDVTISGGIFDGNAATTGKLTMFNTVHCRDITIRGCRFRNGSLWHYIELNSTEHALVTDCIFDGVSYTAMREDLTSELVQVDAPRIGTYGPVFDCEGNEIRFLPDAVPCRNITIRGCVFKCSGFSAIGHHGDDPHSGIRIENNIFTGLSGNHAHSRGYITFMKHVSDVTVAGNAFLSDAGEGQKSLGVVMMNPDPEACVVRENRFMGRFDEICTGGITEMGNVME